MDATWTHIYELGSDYFHKILIDLDLNSEQLIFLAEQYGTDGREKPTDIESAVLVLDTSGVPVQHRGAFPQHFFNLPQIETGGHTLRRDSQKRALTQENPEEEEEEENTESKSTRSKFVLTKKPRTLRQSDQIEQFGADVSRAPKEKYTFHDKVKAGWTAFTGHLHKDRTIAPALPLTRNQRVNCDKQILSASGTDHNQFEHTTNSKDNPHSAWYPSPPNKSNAPKIQYEAKFTSTLTNDEKRRIKQIEESIRSNEIRVRREAFKLSEEVIAAEIQQRTVLTLLAAINAAPTIEEIREFTAESFPKAASFVKALAHDTLLDKEQITQFNVLDEIAYGNNASVIRTASTFRILLNDSRQLHQEALHIILKNLPDPEPDVEDVKVHSVTEDNLIQNKEHANYTKAINTTTTPERRPYNPPYNNNPRGRGRSRGRGGWNNRGQGRGKFSNRYNNQPRGWQQTERVYKAAPSAKPKEELPQEADTTTKTYSPTPSPRGRELQFDVRSLLL